MAKTAVLRAIGLQTTKEWQQYTMTGFLFGKISPFRATVLTVLAAMWLACLMSHVMKPLLHYKTPGSDLMLLMAKNGQNSYESNRVRNYHRMATAQSTVGSLYGTVAPFGATVQTVIAGLFCVPNPTLMPTPTATILCWCYSE